MMCETARGAEYEKEKSRRGYSPIKAVDPHDGGLWDVLVPPKLIDWANDRGMGASKELAYSVRWVLLNPKGFHRGVRDFDREIDEDDWLCYSAIPPDAYDYKTCERHDPWLGQTMMVCVTEERVVYGWWWVRSDPNNPDLPIDHQSRFTEEVF